MSDYHNKRAKEILQKIIYATIATSSNNAQAHTANHSA